MSGTVRTRYSQLLKPGCAVSGDAAARALVKKLLKAGCQPYFQMLGEVALRGGPGRPLPGVHGLPGLGKLLAYPKRHHTNVSLSADEVDSCHCTDPEQGCNLLMLLRAGARVSQLRACACRQ